MNKHFSLQFTILISFLTVLVVACGSIIFYNYKKTSSVFMEDLETEIQQKTNIIITDTENYLRPAKIATKFVAWSIKSDATVLDAPEAITLQAIEFLDIFPQISSIICGDYVGNSLWVSHIEHDATFAYGSKEKLPKTAIYQVQVINRSSGEAIEFLKYLDYNGRIVAVQERPLANDHYDPRNRPWYQQTEERKGSFFSDPYVFFDVSGKKQAAEFGITATTPILDQHNKKLIVIAADLTMDAISKKLVSQHLGKTGITFLMDDQGGLIGYPNLSSIQSSDATNIPSYLDTKNEVLIDVFKKYKKTNLYSFEIQNKGIEYLIRLKPFGESFNKKWLIGFVVPKKELTIAIDDMTKITLIFSGIILLISSTLIYFFSRSISAPIRNVSKTMSAIARFEINESEIKDSRFSEMRLMNDALKHMQQSLKDFSRFVPKAVVSKLIASETGAHIGGRKRNISIMFTDIKSFATISEQLSSEKLIDHLSDYLNHMTHIIQDNHGTIDKYIGDSIMTFWGAPIDDHEHALNACKTAILCKKMLEELNKSWVLDRKPALYTRFGIHTGDAIVGNVGSEDRLNYSALGDSVNLASRLESINKVYNTSIIISHETYRNVQQQFICRPVDIVVVKGKTEGVPIYELLEEVSVDHDKKLDVERAQKLTDLTTEAFNLYLAQDWANAIKKYQILKNLRTTDSIADIFIERCTLYKKKPPPSGWDGAYVMNEK